MIVAAQPKKKVKKASAEEEDEDEDEIISKLKPSGLTAAQNDNQTPIERELAKYH